MTAPSATVTECGRTVVLVVGPDDVVAPVSRLPKIAVSFGRTGGVIDAPRCARGGRRPADTALISISVPR